MKKNYLGMALAGIFFFVGLGLTLVIILTKPVVAEKAVATTAPKIVKQQEPVTEAAKPLTKEQLTKLAETAAAQFITDNPDVDEMEVEVEVEILIIEGSDKFSVEISDMRVNDTTNLDGLKDIASNIEKLSITSDLLKDISLLKGMPLKDLFLHSGELTDISPLKGLSITELNLGCPMLKDISALKGMKSLKNLHVKGCAIESFAPISDLDVKIHGKTEK